jgi:type IV pilus assembly protein PilP
MAASALLGACGSGAESTGTPDPIPAAPAGEAPAAPSGEAPAGGAPGAAAPGAPGSPEAVKKQLLADLRKRPFKNEDFAESDLNRDPFRSFLADFGGTQVITNTRQYKVLLEKFSLEELKLIAIIGPPTKEARGRAVPVRDLDGRGITQSRAMFLDPTGMGVPIVRGDHLSKADAKVVRIDSEKGKVYVEIKEDLGGGKTTTVERVVELHQGEITEGAKP